MGEVVTLNCDTNLPIPPDRVVNGAAEWGLSEVMIIGILDDGEFYAASSETEKGKLLYLLEKARIAVMKA